jgi:hypothetical protein
MYKRFQIRRSANTKKELMRNSKGQKKCLKKKISTAEDKTYHRILFRKEEYDLIYFFTEKFLAQTLSNVYLFPLNNHVEHTEWRIFECLRCILSRELLHNKTKPVQIEAFFVVLKGCHAPYDASWRFRQFSASVKLFLDSTFEDEG